MSATQGSPMRKAWHLWKSLRLPWRKRFLVGQDPQGNTYYELRQPRGDAPESAPHRRLVHYPRSTPYSEVKVPPAWHQWLRHQREFPPTMQEQVAEMQRQARIKVLAAEADARWEAKPSLLDMPQGKAVGQTASQRHERTQPAGGAVEARIETRQQDVPVKETSHQTGSRAGPPDHDPWKRAERGAPGEAWQPEAWTPTPMKKR